MRRGISLERYFDFFLQCLKHKRNVSDEWLNEIIVLDVTTSQIIKQMLRTYVLRIDHLYNYATMYIVSQNHLLSLILVGFIYFYPC